ncbi:MAG: carboxypeptidase regulatory-like domain-containing protein [Alphaproteobacteria bacterium]|nr:carboxypeptidase regulatory-like domain-containing protein [Alphaproteobacteria bacterium]
MADNTQELSSTSASSLGVIQGRLFLDLDGSNGEWNADLGRWDSGISGQLVQLLDEWGNVVAETYTTAGGTYRFEMPPGDYFVRFAEIDTYTFSEKDSVANLLVDSDAYSSGLTDVIHLEAGQVYGHIDVGYVPTAEVGAISGRFFYDANGNARDDGDAGVAGATVQAYANFGSGWVVAAETITDADGNYTLEGLVAHQDYRVRFHNQTGETFVATSVGDDLNDSDVNQTFGEFGQVNSISLGAGEHVTNVDAGVNSALHGTIQGRVFVDADGNNIDNGDAGIAGATVQLYAYSAGYWFVLRETTTDADGGYRFGGLHASNDYRVRVTDHTGEGFVAANVGGNDAIDSDAAQLFGRFGQSGAVAVGTGQTVSDVDFGLRANADGFEYRVLQAGDHVDQEVRSLGGELIVNGGFENHAHAGAIGWWNYGGVTGTALPGWQVANDAKWIELQTGNYNTGNTVGNAIVELDATSGAVEGIQQTFMVVETGTYQVAYDYGVRAYNSVDEPWWLDAESNSFLVYVDDEIVQVTGTGTDSNFDRGFQHRSFDLHLTAGTHTIRFTESGYDSGKSDNGLGAMLDNVSVRQVNMTYDTGVLTGTYYYDGDQDGQRDDGEAGLGGRTVSLLHADNSQVLDADGHAVTATTRADGGYSFHDLAAGDYRVASDGGLSATARVTAGVETSGVDTGTIGATTDVTITVCENETFVRDFDTNCELVSEDVYFMVDQPICARVGQTGFDEDQVNHWNNATTTAVPYYVFLEQPAETDLTFTVRLTVDPNDLPSGPTTYDGAAYLTDQANEINAPRYEEMQVTVKAGQTQSDAFFIGTESSALNFVFGVVIDEIYNHDLDQACERVSVVATTPVAIDLNHDGQIGVTGATSSADKTGLTIGQTVLFDMNADGVAERIEWFDGSGDGILIDNRDGNALAHMDGSRLFGDDNGAYTDGYAKLRAQFDANHDGVVSGAELNGLALWVDDGDAVVEVGELQSLQSYRITEISGQVSYETDAGGREIVRSTVSQDFEATGSVTYQLEGPDAALFTVDENGVVNFKTAPDYENPQDQGKDNVYEVTLVRLTDDPTCEPARENLRIEICDKPSLGDTVWYDTNQNGLQDIGEHGAAGVTVKLLDAASGAVLATKVTDANGHYLFEDLDPGAYKVMFVAPGGYAFTTKAPYGPELANTDSDAHANGMTDTIYLTEGEVQLNIDAGLVDPGTASLGDTVWYDTNKDGLLNNGEQGAGGVTVELINSANGSLVATTITDAAGHYLFDNLKAGIYQVEFVTPNGYALTTQSPLAPDAANNDSDAAASNLTGVVSLSIGEAQRNIDAGLVDTGTASLGDTVWFDANKDGVRNAGEQGAAGLTVSLIDAGTGAALATTVTNANGQYLFDHLDAGNYQVRFTTADGYAFTTASAAAPDAVNNDSDARAGGLTGVISLAAGQAERDVDAGLVQLNAAPVAMDDADQTCADTPVTVDVLANDTDADGNSLTITSVDGQSIADGQTVTASDGVQITLSGGELVFDATGTAYEDALVGTDTGASYAYTVSDGLGGVDSATVDITFHGTTNTLGTIETSLPTSGTLVLSEDRTYGGSLFDVTLSNTGDARFDGVTFESADCLALFEPIDVGVDVPYDFYLAAEGSVPTGILGHPENLDLINWILNQDFASMDNGDGTGQTYTEAEVQGAIWGLTDDFVFVSSGLGTQANAQEIHDLAVANGEGYAAGAGDLVGLVLDPTPEAEANGNVQPLIIGVPFDDLAQDCHTV